MISAEASMSFAQYLQDFPDKPKSQTLGFITIDPKDLCYQEMDYTPSPVISMASPSETPQIPAKFIGATFPTGAAHNPVRASSSPLLSEGEIAYYGKQLDALVAAQTKEPLLEYPVKNMAAFVSWCCFSLMQQERSPSEIFESLVAAILEATCLSLSTITIALDYVDQWFAKMAEKGFIDEQQIYCHMMTALMLANKYNDDRCYSNKSWAVVTGIEIKELNSRERTWLQAMDYRMNTLYRLDSIRDYESCWQVWQTKNIHLVPATPQQTVSPAFSAISRSPFSNLGSYPPSPVTPTPIYQTNVLLQNPSDQTMNAHFYTKTPQTLRRNIWDSNPATSWPQPQDALLNSNFGLTDHYAFSLASCDIGF